MIPTGIRPSGVLPPPPATDRHRPPLMPAAAPVPSAPWLPNAVPLSRRPSSCSPAASLPLGLPPPQTSIASPYSAAATQIWNLDSLSAIFKKGNEVEHLLSEVPQSPSLPMEDALYPVMKALIAQELLRHPNFDVRVSVASCLAEITRITAPDASYNDEVMKEIFDLTVAALGNLFCASGRRYMKAVSILDTMAKVRSCLLMLDLGCNELIAEMFGIFFDSIGTDNADSVLVGMEGIITLVIQESRKISLELLIPLLTSLKKENQHVLSPSWKLGENVLKNCAAKLKPYLPRAVQSMRLTLDDFPEIVCSICQDASEGEHLQINTSESCQSKQLECTDAMDHLDSSPAGNLETEPQSVPRKREWKPNFSVRLEEGYDVSWIGRRRRGLLLSRYGKTSEKILDNSSKDAEPQSVPKKMEWKPNFSVRPEEGYDLAWTGRRRRGLQLPHCGKTSDNILGNSSTDAESKETALPSETDKESEPEGFPSKTSHSESIGASQSRRPSYSDGRQETSVPHMGGKKRNRGNTTSGEESGDKMVPSSVTGSLKKDEDIEPSKTRHKRKRVSQKEEVSEIPHDTKDYGEDLVGCEIKVWWPLDEMFYEGVVSSFDPIQKKHVVIYADGDEETLDLSQDRWELAGKTVLGQRGQETDPPSSDVVSNAEQNK